MSRDAPPRFAIAIALASLVALIGVSIAIALVPVRGASPGYLLATAKVVALLFVFMRVAQSNTYTMQWSSMFILLFMAEGTVRAMSDPRPLAGIGAFEALFALVYFGAVLTWLRPLKKRAREARP